MLQFSATFSFQTEHLILYKSEVSAKSEQSAREPRKLSGFVRFKNLCSSVASKCSASYSVQWRVKNTVDFDNSIQITRFHEIRRFPNNNKSANFALRFHLHSLWPKNVSCGLSRLVSRSHVALQLEGAPTHTTAGSAREEAAMDKNQQYTSNRRCCRLFGNVSLHQSIRARIVLHT
jgi:hypothetical protein